MTSHSVRCHKVIRAKGRKKYFLSIESQLSLIDTELPLTSLSPNIHYAVMFSNLPFFIFQFPIPHSPFSPGGLFMLWRTLDFQRC